MDRYNLQYQSTQPDPEDPTPLSIFVKSYWMIALTVLVVFAFVALIYNEGYPPFSNFVRLPGWLFIGIAKYLVIIITSPFRIFCKRPEASSSPEETPLPEEPVAEGDVPADVPAVADAMTNRSSRKVSFSNDVQVREIKEAFENVDIINDTIRRYDPNSENVLDKKPAHYVAMMGTSIKADLDMVEATGGVYTYM